MEAQVWTLIGVLSATLGTLLALQFTTLRRLDAKIDGLGASLAARIDGLAARVDSLSTRVDGLSTRVDGLTTVFTDHLQEHAR
ncbi:MAG: hypothetical protein ABR600_10135 [Actinomycetota bacterium]